MFETDNLEEAINEWKLLHVASPNEYHEIYELGENSQYHGIRQLKPHDIVN